MNARRTKNSEPPKRKRRGSKDSGTVADKGVPKCNLGTRKPEKTVGLQASIPILGDIKIPGETSLQKQHRLSREGTARRNAEDEFRKANEPEEPRDNPLIKLDDERSARLFTWLRECPFHEAVKAMLAEQGIPDVTDKELNEFFEFEAENHWQRRLSRAATEANALVSYVEKNAVKFSAGILAALGQEAFRQVASGQVAPEAMTRMTNLFLKARADERSDQLMDLRREKMDLDRRTQTEAALEAFAAEIESHPEAREAFEALRAELLRGQEDHE